MSEARIQKALDKVSAERDRLRDELQELRDYAKCYVENNEALQKENAELKARAVELEELTVMLLND